MVLVITFAGLISLANQVQNVISHKKFIFRKEFVANNMYSIKVAFGRAT